jgi:hypothetical protein
MHFIVESFYIFFIQNKMSLKYCEPCDLICQLAVTVSAFTKVKYLYLGFTLPNLHHNHCLQVRNDIVDSEASAFKV